MSCCTIAVWAFAGELSAQHAAHRIARTPTAMPVVVDDAAVVSWPAEQPRPMAWQARDLPARHRLTGAFWGLLFGQLFLLPLSLQTPPAQPVGRFDDLLDCLGLDAVFVRAVRDGVAPGRSSLFLLAPDLTAPAPVDAAAELASRTLTAEQTARLRAGFTDA